MRHYAPEGASDFEIEMETGARVGALLDHMGVPTEENPFIAVNGYRTDRDRLLRDGDTLVLFTSMEGG
jgi:molybdopterin converting factor small subunit